MNEDPLVFSRFTEKQDFLLTLTESFTVATKRSISKPSSCSVSSVQHDSPPQPEKQKGLQATIIFPPCTYFAKQSVIYCTSVTSVVKMWSYNLQLNNIQLICALEHVNIYWEAEGESFQTLCWASDGCCPEGTDSFMLRLIGKERSNLLQSARVLLQKPAGFCCVIHNALLFSPRVYPSSFLLFLSLMNKRISADLKPHERLSLSPVLSLSFITLFFLLRARLFPPTPIRLTTPRKSAIV